MPEFSIVMPAYNEAEKITSSLVQVLGFLNSFSSDYEVLVIDDGSTDDTAKMVENFIRNVVNSPKPVRLVKAPHKGKGPAVCRGVKEAVGEYIYLADADLAAPISELKKLLVWVKDQDFDIAIASREGIGAVRSGEPLYRHVMGRVFNIVVQTFVLPGIRDSQCGFKLFKNSVAKALFSKLILYSDDSPEIKSAYLGAYDVEVLYLARKFGYRVKEVPIYWSFVKTARLNPVADSVAMARDVLNIKFNDLKGKYRL